MVLLATADTVEDDLVIDGGADFGGSTEFGIASDVFSQQTGKVGYIRTRLCTYVAPSETPEGLTGEQEVKLLDSSELATSPIWDNAADIYVGTTISTDNADTVTNLNGQEDTDAGQDTGKRLLARFGLADTDMADVVNDTALILGSVQNATGVSATLVSGSGTPTTQSFSASSGEFEIAVTGTEDGSEFLITPTGAFGVTGETLTVTVNDLVAPTTLLQENYELWAIETTDYAATTASAGTGATGSGGEVAEGSVSGEAGDPIIYIQPRHLSPTSNANISERYDEFDSFDFSEKLDIAAEANDNPLYSGPGYASWSDRSNSLGVAFSETIATGAVAPLESASVDLTLTGVLNGLTTDVDGQTILGQQDTADNGNTLITNSGSDLARFTVSDMVDFANNDHDEAIDFTNGSIVDAFGNLANDNSEARVIIRDAMPPFVTAARWDGSNVIITFNETIVPEDEDKLVLTNLNDTTLGYPLELDDSATASTEGYYTLNAAGNELTVVVGATNIAGLFQNGTDDKFVFDSDGDTITENHLALNFDDIEDARGNSWATFDRDENSAPTIDTDGDLANGVNSDGYDRFGRYLVDAPRFMMYNDVGIFTITKQTIGYSDATGSAATGDDDGEVTLRFTFSHPIDISNATNIGSALDGATTGGSYSGTSLTQAQANVLFTIDLDGAGAGGLTPLADVTGEFSASFSSDYTTITLNLDEGVDAIEALVTQVQFIDTVESAITDEALAAETYTVVNSN